MSTAKGEQATLVEAVSGTHDDEASPFALGVDLSERPFDAAWLCYPGQDHRPLDATHTRSRRCPRCYAAVAFNHLHAHLPDCPAGGDPR